MNFEEFEVGRFAEFSIISPLIDDITPSLTITTNSNNRQMIGGKLHLKII